MQTTEQIATMRLRLNESLLRKEVLTRELKTCQEQIDGLSNYIAGAEAGEKVAAERLAAEKAAAEKAAAEKAGATST